MELMEITTGVQSEKEAANVDGLLAGPIFDDPGAGQLTSGRMYAANDSRFVATNYSLPLTAYTVGWSDPDNIQALLDQIAPPIDSAERFTFKMADNTEAFLSESDDIRPIGSSFKRVEYTGKEVDGRVYNKGLVIRVDNDEQVGGDWQERYTGYLLARLARNDLRRAVAGLNAAATDVPVIWDADSNPDGDLRKQLRLAKPGSGLRPTVALWGGAAWDARAQAYEASQANAAKFMRGGDTQEQVRQRLMLDTMLVSEAVYGTGAATKQDIIGQIIILYNAAKGATKDDPSNIKRFVYKTAQGYFRVYVQTFNKYTEVTVEHYSREYIINTLGMVKLTITSPF